jgi:predicted transposase/invertase (TIGR01784 family)
MLLTEYNESEERELFRQEVLEEGRAEGREEGKEESQRETAKKMMGDGLPVNMISKYTGLSASDIAALRC